MKIKLDKRHTLISDQFCCWIEQTRKSEKTGKEYQVRVTGYCARLDQVFDSYLDKRLLGADPETVSELRNEIREIRSDIVDMCNGLDAKVLEAMA